MQRLRRVLFVDDEDTIRLTLPAILRMHKFEVTTAGSVADALAAINRDSFDVLLADLNIGQPGDGFTVVSAMRRTHPEAVTIIITGYPAFETALQAIRNQVDDYVVKPADIPQLIDIIEGRLSKRQPHLPLTPRRVAALLRERMREVLEQWLVTVDGDEEISAVALSHEQRAHHLPWVMQELTEMLETPGATVSAAAMKAAEKYGHLRREQGYSIPVIMKEWRLLRAVIYRVIQQNLLVVDISNLLTDLINLSDSLDLLARRAVEAYLSSPELAA